MKTALNICVFIIGSIATFSGLVVYQKADSIVDNSKPVEALTVESPSAKVLNADSGQRENAAKPDESRYLRMDPASALSELAMLRPTNAVQGIRRKILDDLLGGNCSPSLVKNLRPLLSGEEYRPFLAKIFSSFDMNDPGKTSQLFSVFEKEMSLPQSRTEILNAINQSLHGVAPEILRNLFQGVHSELIQQNILKNYCNTNNPADFDPNDLISFTEKWNPRARNIFIGDMSLRIMESSPEKAIVLASGSMDPNVLERVLVEGINMENSTNANVSASLQVASEFTRFEAARNLAEKLVSGGKSADYLITSISRPIAPTIRKMTQVSIGQTLASQIDAVAFGALLIRLPDSETRGNLIHGQTLNGDSDYSTALKNILKN